jgi:processing peptidase subunit alpha
MSRIGANVLAMSSSDLAMYGGEVLIDFAPHMFRALAEFVQFPRFAEDELQDMRDRYESRLQSEVKPKDVKLLEDIHATAYSGKTLGLSHSAPACNLSKFTPEVLREHMRLWYTPSRMVIAGVGIPHKELVGLVNEHLTNLSPDSNVNIAPAEYTGGEMRVPIMDADTPLTQIALAFETVSWLDPDLVPMCVLQMLMGGGGSFSAGGPGKGMYSRLFENVLNKYEWAMSANCFNSIHSDSSIFGFTGACPPEFAGEMVKVLADEANKMKHVKADELDRAKRQLKSAVFMLLETKMAMLDDMGRQLFTYGHIQSPQQIADKIDAVTQNDIDRVASKMMRTNLTYVVQGDLSSVPTHKQVVEACF